MQEGFIVQFLCKYSCRMTQVLLYLRNSSLAPYRTNSLYIRFSVVYLVPVFVVENRVFSEKGVFSNIRLKMSYDTRIFRHFKRNILYSMPGPGRKYKVLLFGHWMKMESGEGSTIRLIRLRIGITGDPL